MKIGIVGLGRMGGNMARRFARGGVRVVGYDPDASVRGLLAGEGVIEEAATSVELVRALAPPRVVWLMVPAGATTELAVQDVWPEMSRGDVLVDGGNANYKDSQRRAAALASAGIAFVDCGVSGGIWGLENGYALMFGGTPAAARAIEPLARVLAPAPDRGWLHCGPAGSGHFVKMIHNGIEYGMMQAFAEGFSILKHKEPLALDLAQVAEIWRHGSVVRSWLLDLTARALQANPTMDGVAPYVSDSGEGRWTVAEAIALDVAAPVMTLALLARLRSRDAESYGDRLLAALRNQFGGHAVKHEGGA